MASSFACETLPQSKSRGSSFSRSMLIMPLTLFFFPPLREIMAVKRLKMEKEKDGFPITSLREINTLLKVSERCPEIRYLPLSTILLPCPPVNLRRPSTKTWSRCTKLSSAPP